MSKVTSHHNDLIKKSLLSVATTLGKGPGATQQVGTVAARISTDLRSSPTILGPTRPAATTGKENKMQVEHKQTPLFHLDNDMAVVET